VCRGGQGWALDTAGAPASPPLDEQRANQQTLAGERADDPGNLPFVIAPEVRLAEEDHAALGQPLLVDPPASQLPPVEHQRVGRLGNRGERRDRLTLEQADRETGRVLSVDAVPEQVAADDSVAEPHFSGPERWGIRSPGDPASADPMTIAPSSGTLRP
jgi:hypothetical protein